MHDCLTYLIAQSRTISICVLKRGGTKRLIQTFCFDRPVKIMPKICRVCRRSDDSGLPVCSCGYSYSSGTVVSSVAPSKEVRRRMSGWRITKRIVLGSVFVFVMSLFGVIAVLLEYPLPDEARNESMSSLSQPAPQAAVHTVKAAEDSLEPFIARVTSVHTGDVIVVVDKYRRQHRVRLLGVETPVDEMGREAKENLESLVKERSVNVTPLKAEKSALHAKVIRSGKDIGLEQIRAGMARLDRAVSELPEADRRIYAEMEAAARRARVGMWYDVKLAHAADADLVVHRPADNLR